MTFYYRSRKFLRDKILLICNLKGFLGNLRRRRYQIYRSALSVYLSSSYDHELYLNNTSLCSGILLFDKGCFSNSSNACSLTTECPSLTAKLNRAVEL